MSFSQTPFREADEPFDLVTFIAGGENRGKFMHTTSDRDTSFLIEKPNEYRGLSLDQRSVILKIHGTVNRLDPEGIALLLQKMIILII